MRVGLITIKRSTFVFVFLRGFPLRSTKLWPPRNHFFLWKSRLSFDITFAGKVCSCCKQVIEVDVSFNFIIKQSQMPRRDVKMPRFRKACHNIS